MKLLIDQNLPPALARDLADVFPGSTHVRQLGYQRAPDRFLLDYARDHGYAVLTRDYDFVERVALMDHPPKVIWLRRRNCRTRDIAATVRHHEQQILAMEHDAHLRVLIIA